MMMIQAYATSTDAVEIELEHFHNDLQYLVDTIPKKMLYKLWKAVTLNLEVKSGIIRKKYILCI